MDGSGTDGEAVQTWQGKEAPDVLALFHEQCIPFTCTIQEGRKELYL
jgi:hypothetical protein